MSRTPILVRREESRKAFTLIELLVVIGIIGVLLSILLPVLSKVHRAANTLACSANLHEVLLAMQNYCSLYNNWIPGSPQSTGAFLYKQGIFPATPDPQYSDNNCPNVCGIWDWQSPLGYLMGIHFDPGGSLTSRQSRFTTLMNAKIFNCAENQWVSGEYPNTSGTALWNNGTYIPAPSYVTAEDFLLEPNFVTGATFNTKQLLEVYCEWTTTIRYFQLPPGYGPKLTKVGPPSRKIYIADGAIYSAAIPLTGTQPSLPYPNYSMDYMNTAPTWNSYADYGAYNGFSRGLVRSGDTPSKVNGLALNPADAISSSLDSNDPRLYSFRHGTLKAFQEVNAYRFNAGFYDGHVETLGDLEGADPNLWNPPGTQIDPAEVMLDVQAQFFPQHPAGSTALLTTN